MSMFEVTWRSYHVVSCASAAAKDAMQAQIADLSPGSLTVNYKVRELLGSAEGSARASMETASWHLDPPAVAPPPLYGEWPEWLRTAAQSDYTLRNVLSVAGDAKTAVEFWQLVSNSLYAMLCTARDKQT